MPDDPKLLLSCFDLCVWLFERTPGFPKRLRQSLTARMEQTALELLEALTGAQYAAQAEEHLQRASLALDRLRLLLRLAHALRALDTRAYEHSAEALTEIGRMLGGWLRTERSKARGSR